MGPLSYWDYLEILDDNDNRVGLYTGTQLAGQTITVPGDMVKFRVTTDGSVSSSGYTVTKIVSGNTEITTNLPSQRNLDNNLNTTTAYAAPGSGLYYCQTRYYDPVVGRFINADGLVSTGTGILGTNMFAYCNNNPIIFADSSGMCHGFADVSWKVAGRNTPGCYDAYMHEMLEADFASGALNDPRKSLLTKAINGLSNISTEISIGLGISEHALKDAKKLVLKDNGYFKALPKYSKTLKGISAAGYALDGGLLVWDVYSICPDYTTGQKASGIAIAVGGTAAGIGVGYLAVTLANCWNPFGWGLLAVGGTIIGVSMLGGIAIDNTKDYLYDRVGIYR